MKAIRLIFSLTLILSLASCEKGHPCGANESDRVGAKCMDGTRSNATGSGACSSHGGVDYWLCGD